MLQTGCTALANHRIHWHQKLKSHFLFHQNRSYVAFTNIYSPALYWNVFQAVNLTICNLRISPRFSVEPMAVTFLFSVIHWCTIIPSSTSLHHSPDEQDSLETHWRIHPMSIRDAPQLIYWVHTFNNHLSASRKFSQGTLVTEPLWRFFDVWSIRHYFMLYQ